MPTSATLLGLSRSSPSGGRTEQGHDTRQPCRHGDRGQRRQHPGQLRAVAPAALALADAPVPAKNRGGGGIDGLEEGDRRPRSGQAEHVMKQAEAQYETSEGQARPGRGRRARRAPELDGQGAEMAAAAKAKVCMTSRPAWTRTATEPDALASSATRPTTRSTRPRPRRPRWPGWRQEKSGKKPGQRLTAEWLAAPDERRSSWLSDRLWRIAVQSVSLGSSSGRPRWLLAIARSPSGLVPSSFERGPAATTYVLPSSLRQKTCRRRPRATT